MANSSSVPLSPSVITARPCPALGGFQAEVISSVDRHGKPLRNVCWTESGFIGVDPIPILDVSEFYKNEYRQAYKGSFTPQKRHVLRAARCAMERYQRIKALLTTDFSSSCRTLDAGASSGEFVYLMKQLGHDAWGIEPHIGYASHARETLGLNVDNCTFAEFVRQEKPFDVITLFHVLEHLEFPVQDLLGLRSMLGEEGIFVIEVPNILYRGMKFSHKWHKGHLNGFTATSLEVTAAMAGLEALHCGEIGDGGNLFGIFHQAQPLSLEGARSRLNGNAESTIQTMRSNTNLDYFTRPDTWAKIPRKFLTQIEERKTASKHRDSKTILDAVYSSLS